ncbi:MAG TPA: hypothetical protein V6D22_10640 [Candidatus Obscuribacterales bacterium]
MKLSFYISLLALVGISTMQAASAQDAHNARFNYAPNVWKAEHANLPKGYGDYVEPQHNVRAGAVPQGNVLTSGLDPMMLSKPAPKSPVVTTAATPRIMAPQTNANFNPAFGRPVMAQLPSVMPQHATALPMTPQAPMAKPVAATPIAQAVKPVMAKKMVFASMKRPAFQNAKPASAPAQVASYGDNFLNKNFGVGPVLPRSGSRSASGANATVTGVILSKHSH